MKKYLILALVMVAVGLLILKTYEIRSRYTSPIGEGYNISASETITAIIPAKSLDVEGEIGTSSVDEIIPPNKLKEFEVTPEFIMKDSDVEQDQILINFSATDDNLIKSLDDIKVRDFTFYSKGEEIKIDLEDFKSMTAQEVRDFIRLVSTILILYEKDTDLDPEIIGIWGMKLLPRFFNPNPPHQSERR